MSHKLILNRRTEKFWGLLLCASFLALINGLAAQAPIASDPVGTASTLCPTNSDTFVSIPYTRSPEFAGLIQSTSGNVITVVGMPNWTSNQFVYAAGSQPKHYYALIGSSSTSNPKEGHTYSITANSSNTLTVDTTQDNLAGTPSNTQIILIPYWTLATVFPPSDQNVSFTPTTSTTSYQTQIRIPSSTATGINLPYSPIYFFLSNVGWRVVGDNTTDHGDDILLQNRYFVVRNDNSAPTLPLTSLGAFATKKLTVPLKTGTSGQQDNPVSILRPWNVALNATGLGPADGSFAANDQLLLFDNTQAALDKIPSATYYYDTHWRLTGQPSNDRGNDVIPAGTGFVIRKAATTSGQTALWTNPLAVAAISAVSQKTHGTAGTFDVNLPLTGTPGIECRAAGGADPGVDHKIVFTFPTAVTLSSAAVTSGTGNVTVSGSGTPTITANLSGVANVQWLTLTLLGVSDGTNTNDVAVRVGFLRGDTTANGLVNSSDIAQTQSQAGQFVDATNFREDVTVNGVINSSDIVTVQSSAGTALP